MGHERETYILAT